MGWTTTLTGTAKSVSIDGGGSGSFTGGANATSEGLKLTGHIQHTFSGNTQHHVNLEIVRAGGTEVDPWIGLSGDELIMDSVRATGTLGQVVDFIRLTGERSRLSDWWVETNRHGLVLSGAIRNVITDWYMSVGSQADNTWDGINLTTSDYNLIDGIQVVGDGGVADPRCGVNITDAASNDNYVGIVHAPDAQTAPICDSGTDTLLIALEKPWQTWTPSWTNLTVGNGTEVARYTQIGKTIHVHYTLTFGSTTSIGASNPRVTLPVTPSTTYTIGRANLGNAYLVDASPLTGYDAIVRLQSTTEISVGFWSVSGASLVQNNISSTAPITWTTGDTLDFAVTYEAA